jgi:predicted 2-oxoglutarate/Fe(II)-dependent dioxygenase YbiX
MEFNYIADGIDAVVIDNFYSELQLTDISKELDRLTNDRIMVADKDRLEAAVDVDGNFVTTKYGAWVNDVNCPLIKYPVENFTKQEVFDKLVGFNSMYRVFFHMNRRSHLISYYENAGYYSKHIDASVFTILSYFHKEPKQFRGGDIILHSSDFSKKVTIETRNNRVVILPSCTVHEVTQIEMTSKILDGTGRYCCSIFASIEYLKDREKQNDFN